MTSFLSHLNPTPSFPAYTGPYKVGTVDVELSISELYSPAPSPDPLISTVSFRMFYPCDDASALKKSVYWIPEPQHDYISAYARFLGASSKISYFLAHFPRLLYHVTIPVTANAKLLSAHNTSKRWPVLIFSHGLGGSRNAYSHLLGLLSSYGIVAIAPEHRDGSAPVSFVKDSSSSKLIPIDYQVIPHDSTREVQEARDKQLRIRLWELGVVHEALLKIDQGETLSNIASDAANQEIKTQNNLLNFASSLDVQRPGSISWAGHSFGAATIVQFVKSVFYRSTQHCCENYRPLYVPSDSSTIVRQITPFSTVSLLDLWTLPLRSESTKWLWASPLPCYTDDGPGGSIVLAILSEGFFKWRGNLILTKKAISANPSDERRQVSTRSPPRIFYSEKTAHLSQSDFGVLFPWLTKRVFKAEEPERTLKLNVLAILELMRQSGLDIPAPSDVDKAAVFAPVRDPSNDQTNRKVWNSVNGYANGTSKSMSLEPVEEIEILSVYGSTRGWIAVNVNAEDLPGEGEDKETTSDASPSDAVQQTEVDRQQGTSRLML